jgi:hypothetical protein
MAGKSSVWARHAARFTVESETETREREVVAPANDQLAGLKPKISKRVRIAEYKRDYRRSMQPLASDDWERIRAQAAESARLKETASAAMAHARAALEASGYVYPLRPLFLMVRRAMNTDVDRRQQAGELARFRRGAALRARKQTNAATQAPQVLTVELVTTTVCGLAFPGGAVGAEGRFHWLVDKCGHLRSLMNSARKALPGAELTEIGVSQGPYGVAVYFVLDGVRHSHCVDPNATRERTRARSTCT